MSFTFPPQVSENNNPNFDLGLKSSAVGFNNSGGRPPGDASEVLTDRKGLQTPIYSSSPMLQIGQSGRVLSECSLVASSPTLERLGSPLADLSHRDIKKARSGVLEANDSQGVGDLPLLPGRSENPMIMDVAAHTDVLPSSRQSYAAVAAGPGKESAKEFHGISEEDIVVQDEDKETISGGDNSDTIRDKESHEGLVAAKSDLYGPWMIVDSRRRRSRKQNTHFPPSKPVADSIGTSQFAVLQDSAVEDSVHDAGVGKGVFPALSTSAAKGATAKRSLKGPTKATVVPGLDVNASCSGTKEKSNSVDMPLGSDLPSNSVTMAVEPVVPGCQPVVVEHVGRGNGSNHVAMAIVDDG
ncbi:hypothetical protein V6N13_028335 [Hibiscus sabdariffa]